MKNLRFSASLALAGASGCSLAAAWGQAAPITVENQAVSHTLEVAALEPTAQRIANLQLPTGFTLTKFAEMSNPRIIVVAPNGNVYISQRESGTLVLLNTSEVSVEEAAAIGFVHFL